MDQPPPIRRRTPDEIERAMAARQGALPPLANIEEIPLGGSIPAPPARSSPPKPITGGWVAIQVGLALLAIFFTLGFGLIPLAIYWIARGAKAN